MLGDLRLERAGAGRRIAARAGEIDVDHGGAGFFDADLGIQPLQRGSNPPQLLFFILITRGGRLSPESTHSARKGETYFGHLPKLSDHTGIARDDLSLYT